MTKVDLTTHVRQLNDKACAIDLVGEVNGFAENILMDAFTQASSGAKAVVLNFEKLVYLNSSGIGLLVTILIRAQRAKQRLLACGLSEHYKQIFELTRLNEAIGIYDTEAEALASVS